jgi:hypothetical protein
MESGFSPASDRSCRGIGLAGLVRRGLRALRKKGSAYRPGFPRNRPFPSSLRRRSEIIESIDAVMAGLVPAIHVVKRK